MAQRDPPQPTAARAAAPPELARARFPEPVLEVLRALANEGYPSWLVGGAVRDLLLGRERTGGDHDVATPARPAEVKALFPKVIPTGEEHGTVTVLARGTPVEVTTFRGEGAYLDGRRPSSVTFLDDVDQDLARRDFTVNALAYDPLSGAFRDPFGGRDDLARRVLRAVGDPAERFAEDGLRPLRAARFAAQLGFALDAATRAAIPGALPVVARVAVERVAEELSRLVVAADAPLGLALLVETGLLPLVVPELAAAPPDARAHAFAAAAAADPDLALRLAALLHVLAPGDAALAAERARGALARLRMSNAIIDAAAALVRDRRCALDPRRTPLPESDADVRRWLARVGRERVAAVLALWRADVASGSPSARTGGEGSQRAEDVAHFTARVGQVDASHPPLSTAELALDGQAVMRHLGIPAGRAVGEALRHALDRVLDDPSLNTPDALASELRTWWSERASRS